MATIGTLIAELGLETAAFHRDMGKAVANLQSSSAQMNRSLAGIERGFQSVSRTIVALAGPAVMMQMIKRQIDLGDQLNKTAQILGTSVESWSAYQYAARLANVENDQLRAGVVRLGESMKDSITNPTSDAARTFELLGIKVTDSNGKLRSTDAVLEDVAKRFAGAEDGIGKTNAAVALFGQKAGPALIPMLNQLQELTAEARDTGNVVSSEFAQKSELFNDSMAKMQLAAGNHARMIASNVLPALTAWVEKINVLIGAQQRLSLQTLEQDRAALANEMVRLREREQQLGFTEPFVAAQKAKVLAEIDALDALIIAENKRLMNLQNAKKGGGDGGGNKIPDLGGLGPNVSEFDKLMQGLRKESARAQTDILADEYSKTQARIKLAESEWRFKAEAARLNKDQRIQFEEELSQYLADKTAADLAKVAEEKEKKQVEAAADFERLRMTFDAEYAAQEERRIRLLELDAYYREFGLQQDQTYNQLREQIELEHLARLGDMQAKAKLEGLKFEKLTMQQKLQTVVAFGASELAAVANSNKTLFQMHKAFALAQLAIEMPAAIGAAIERGGGLPWGAVFGTLTAAKYVALIAQTKSANFGSSTSPANVSGGGAIPVMPTEPLAPAVPPQTQTADPVRQTDVYIRQGIYSANDLRDIVLPELWEAIGDGVGRGVVNISVV